MHLIIQGLDVGNYDLRALAKLAGADEIEKVSGQAFRLKNIQQQDGISDYCEEAKLDYAVVGHDLNLTDFKLIAMDMDSTLLAIESIDEIADIHHTKQQVAEITLKTMRGEISFEESLTQRTALLRGVHIDALQKVYEERMRLSPGAEIMLKKAKTAGLKTMVISGGFTFFTDRIKEKLQLDFATANTFEVQENRLTGKVLGKILGREGKAEALSNVCDKLGISRNQVIAIGDGANDLDMLAAAGISIAYHAKPVVQQQATFSLNHVGLDGVINLFNR
ncbi:phosphoserine phosphatase SerB [Nitrosomonas marina]|uniref:Phosphoserine phosphatase n=1 Tax=Nitrosomonas marina TaxID=917 RepID=A0A1H8CB48_9PROT|nr:phosphoserine phosphatase SerB [Nitrosomonas marina]SEM91498.1 phosphoserine phosphatase [Nitrosomonas marina]